MGETQNQRFQLSFNASLRVDFEGSPVTFDAPVGEYNEKVEYIHLNPVKAGLVRRGQDWRWSSANEYSGMSAAAQEQRCGLRIDRVSMPSDPKTRIGPPGVGPRRKNERESQDLKGGGLRYLVPQRIGDRSLKGGCERAGGGVYCGGRGCQNGDPGEKEDLTNMREQLWTTVGLFLFVLAWTFCARVGGAQQTCAPNGLKEGPAAFFSGMVAWWPATASGQTSCDPAAGCPGYNDIIGGNNGTSASNATFADGEVGQAFSFNGTDESVQVPNSSTLKLGSGEITLDAWINAPPFNGTNDVRTIVAKSNPSYPFQAYFLRTRGDNKVEFAATDCGTGACGFSGEPGSGFPKEPVRSTHVVADNTWHHVAGVRRADGTREIWVDGNRDNTRSESMWDTDSDNALYIGEMDGTGIYRFTGLADEVEVFNRALSASEIQAIFNARNAGKCPQARFARPTLMGVSVGNTTGTPSPCPPGSTRCAAGTAGLLVHAMGIPSEKFILSNNHVLGAIYKDGKYCPNTATPGTWTLQPGTLDIGADPGKYDFYHVGNFFAAWPLLHFPFTNEIDAAISLLTDPAVATSEIFGIGQPNPHVMMAWPDQDVIKSGRGSGVTNGRVGDVNWFGIVPGDCGKYLFAHQIAIKPLPGFTVGGDSGSAVLDAPTKTPVGLLIGYSCFGLPFGCWALANPISTVYQDLNVFPDSPSEAGPTSAEELEAEVQSSQKNLDPRLARLEEIQDRHENEVLRIPGVQGIGIGLDENGQDLVFHVYVIERTPGLTAVVPREIEGVPVRFIETGGEFKLL